MASDEENAEGASGTVQSVAMSWRLLDELGRSVAPMRLTELANLLGEPKAKVHRHLATMRKLGVVEQLQGSEKYRLGWKLYKLGQLAFEQFDLKALAEPHMARLRDEVRQSVVLAIPTGVEALFISNLDYTSAEQPRISAVPGTVVPPAAAATGRIILAFAPKKQQDRILSQPLRAYTSFTITDTEQLRARLRTVRERLYDYGCQELTLGISTVAAPILGPDDELLGAVSIVGSMQFITDPPDPKQIASVQRCAAAISREFKSTAYERIADRLG
jgi:IclR family transcriptional regulator, KDG regulon repressor